MKIVVMKINFPFAMMGGWVGWSYSGFFLLRSNYLQYRNICGQCCTKGTGNVNRQGMFNLSMQIYVNKAKKNKDFVASFI